MASLPSARFGNDGPMPMDICYNNQYVIFIANSLVFYECTNHTEVDCHLIWDLLICNLLICKQIVTPYIRSDDQLGDFLNSLQSLCLKLLFSASLPS